MSMSSPEPIAFFRFIQPRLNMPETLPFCVASPPSCLISACSSDANCARWFEQRRNNAFTLSSWTCSAAVRKPCSPSRHVSIRSFRQAMSSSRLTAIGHFSLDSLIDGQIALKMEGAIPMPTTEVLHHRQYTSHSLFRVSPPPREFFLWPHTASASIVAMLWNRATRILGTSAIVCLFAAILTPAVNIASRPFLTRSDIRPSDAILVLGAEIKTDGSLSYE